MWGSSRARLIALALLVGACVDFGSSSSSSNGQTTVVADSDPRLLDQVCGEGKYQLEGDARLGFGLTPDSCGFELGPGGVVSFPMAVDSETDEVTALVVDLDDGGARNARWIHPSIVQPDNNADPPRPLPLVRVSAGNQHLGVVDLHIKTTYVITDDYNGCSVAHRRRAPRDVAR